MEINHFFHSAIVCSKYVSILKERPANWKRTKEQKRFLPEMETGPFHFMIIPARFNIFVHVFEKPLRGANFPITTVKLFCLLKPPLINNILQWILYTKYIEIFFDILTTSSVDFSVVFSIKIFQWRYCLASPIYWRNALFLSLIFEILFWRV